MWSSPQDTAVLQCPVLTVHHPHNNNYSISSILPLLLLKTDERWEGDIRLLNENALSLVYDLMLEPLMTIFSARLSQSKLSFSLIKLKKHPLPSCLLYDTTEGPVMISPPGHTSDWPTLGGCTDNNSVCNVWEKTGLTLLWWWCDVIQYRHQSCPVLTCAVILKLFILQSPSG